MSSLMSNEELAATATGAGADRTQTVTPANPTPPTNIPGLGETPPTSEGVLERSLSDWGSAVQEQSMHDPEALALHWPELMATPDTRDAEAWEDPLKFAASTSGLQPEAAGTEEEHTHPQHEEPKVVTMTAGPEGYTTDPNATHPSSLTPSGETGATGPEQPAALTATSLSPDTAVIGGPDLDMHVTGTGFTDQAVIVFNDGDEATTFHSDTDVSTTVKPSTASSAVAVPVVVRQAGEATEPLTFTFTAAQ